MNENKNQPPGLKQLLINNAFRGFDSVLQNELNNAGSLVLIKREQIIVATGAQLKNTILILSGCLKVYRENRKADGKEFIITYLQAGHGFGVSLSKDSLPDANISPLTFKAMEPSYILTISFEEKDILAKRSDQWYKFILQTAVQFYGFYINLIDSISFNNL